MTRGESTRGPDERLGMLAEVLAQAVAAGEVIDRAALAARFDMPAEDIADCARGLEQLAECLGEDLPPDLGGRVAVAPPSVPGDYEILDEIGRGGMGIVYRARQRSLGRDVAIKVLRPGDLTFGEAVARFRSEARSLARLRHRHIVSIHEVGESDEGFVYYTMDLIEGETLAEVLERGPMTPSRAVRLMRQVTAAIVHAHGEGIVHRDLKPHNILLDAHGDAFVVDFGLARDAEAAGPQTLSGVLVGTPAYMSPEQARGDVERIGEASDVWALGALLYECLTGVGPFSGRPLHETIRAILHEDPLRPRKGNPRIPVDLEVVCLKALERQPQQRYATALAFGEDLERFADGRPIRARRRSPAVRAARTVWRWREPLLAAVAGAAVLVAFIGRQAEDSSVAFAAAGDRLSDSGEFAGAVETYRLALDVTEPGAARDTLELKLVRALLDGASVEHPAGNTAAAARWANEALTIIDARPEVQPNVFTAEQMERAPVWRFEQACGRALIGDQDSLDRLPIPLDRLPPALQLRSPRRRAALLVLAINTRPPRFEWLAEQRGLPARTLPDLLRLAAAEPRERVGRLSHIATAGAVVANLWTPQLEPAIAAVAEDEAAPWTTRLLALSVLTRAAGLPLLRVRWTDLPDAEQSHAAELLGTWRSLQAASREDAYRLRVDLVLALLSGEENPGNLLFPGLSQHYEELTGRDFGGLARAHSWWASTRDKDHADRLAGLLGARERARDVDFLIDRMFDAKSGQRTLWQQLLMLAVPEETVVPGFDFARVGDGWAARRGWLQALGKVPQDAFRVRMAGLLFQDGDPRPQLLWQESVAACFGDDVVFDSGEQQLPSYGVGVYTPFSLQRGNRIVYWPPRKIEPRAGAVWTSFRGRLTFEAGGPQLRGSVESLINPYSFYQISAGPKHPVLETGIGQCVSAETWAVTWPGPRRRNMVHAVLVGIEPETEPDAPWTLPRWRKGVEAILHADRSQEIEGLWGLAQLWPLPGWRAVMSKLGFDESRWRYPRLLGGDHSAITLPEYEANPLLDLGGLPYVRLLLGSPSETVREHALDQLHALPAEELWPGPVHVLRQAIDRGELDAPDWLRERIAATAKVGMVSFLWSIAGSLVALLCFGVAAVGGAALGFSRRLSRRGQRRAGLVALASCALLSQSGVAVNGFELLVPLWFSLLGAVAAAAVFRENDWLRWLVPAALVVTGSADPRYGTAALVLAIPLAIVVYNGSRAARRLPRRRGPRAVGG